MLDPPASSGAAEDASGLSSQHPRRAKLIGFARLVARRPQAWSKPGHTEHLGSAHPLGPHSL